MIHTNSLQQPDRVRAIRAEKSRVAQRSSESTPPTRRGTTAKVVFLIGNPGSGKSTVSQEIQLRLADWHVPVFDDYTFLRGMFEDELAKPRVGKQRAFRADRRGSTLAFEVLDFSVLQIVLYRMNARIQDYVKARKTLILIEFARNVYTYWNVWQYFSSNVLMDSHAVFLRADPETCIDRVKRRAEYVPEAVMRGYYGSDPLPGLLKGRARPRLDIMHTDGTLTETRDQVKRLLDDILREKT